MQLAIKISQFLVWKEGRQDCQPGDDPTRVQVQIESKRQDSEDPWNIYYRTLSIEMVWWNRSSGI
jgi:hypothetical protein